MGEAPTAPRIAVVIRYVVWVGIIAHAGFIPLFAWLGHPLLALFNVASVVSWVAALLVSRRGHPTLAMWIITAEVAVHAVLATTACGWDSGFQYYLIPLIPFVMFNDRLGTRTIATVWAAVVLTYAGLHALSPTLQLDARVAAVLVYSNMVIPFVALGLVTYYFRLASTQAEQRMAQMALTDPLTGLYNRRHMGDLLERAQSQFTRDRRPFCVILADIDHFKNINDDFGHAQGDGVLRAVAVLFNEQLRGRDAVARWGGEEFLVLLAETPLERAREVAQRLRSSAEARLGKLPGLSRGVTLTFGLSAYTIECPITVMLKTADEALYAGKAGGRNQVVVGGEEDGAVQPPLAKN
jgi:diguanylate cyclase (GGDEF)-like protein